jgi:hypothetical protein
MERVPSKAKAKGQKAKKNNDEDATGKKDEFDSSPDNDESQKPSFSTQQDAIFVRIICTHFSYCTICKHFSHAFSARIFRIARIFCTLDLHALVLQENIVRMAIMARKFCEKIKICTATAGKICDKIKIHTATARRFCKKIKIVVVLDRTSLGLSEERKVGMVLM